MSRLTRPVLITRDPERARGIFPNAEVWRWEPHNFAPSQEVFRGIDVIFHLAGEPIAEGRWDSAKKARIRETRVTGTRRLVDALESLPNRPPVLISASAVGYYGDRGDEILDESSPPGKDFLAEVCQAWEAEALRAAARGVRVVTARIGVVLGDGGGALTRMLVPFKLGLGGRLSDGRQWMSWIHLDDLAGLLLQAAENSAIAGPMNAVAPEPLTNREFTRSLAAALHRPAIFPVPKFALNLAFGEMSSILLASQRVLPQVALKAGYRYRYPKLADALRAALAVNQEAPPAVA